MSTATARAYQPHFAGRFMPSRTRKSPQNKAFYGHRGTYSGKAHCIKDRVLLDGACGTGGMLTVAQDRLETLALRRNKKVSIHLFGQELQPETYAICKADMLLKGEGEQAEHISYGSTLSADGNATRQFDFMLSNPPYGKSWKTDADKMGGKKEILDSRFNAYLTNGEQLSMIPRVSDGQLLFLLNNTAKMKSDTPLGSRIAEVHNASSLFSGDAGSGESNARRFLIENDYVEAIIALPESMFYNTSLGTYIWIVSNKKEDRRKGKIQLIDASNMKEEIKKKLGDKKFEITPELRKQIINIYLAFEDGEYSRIFPNEEFGYYSVTVNRPLRLRVAIDDDSISAVKSEDEQLAEAIICLQKILLASELNDYNAVLKKLTQILADRKVKFTAKRLKLFRNYCTSVAEEAEKVMLSNGNTEANKDLSDVEKIPMRYPGGIDTYFETEVKPYSPDAWIDTESISVGYELGFTEYFYKPKKMRDMQCIIEDILRLEKTTDGLLSSIFGGEA